MDVRCGGGQKESAVLEKDMHVFLETVKQHFQERDAKTKTAIWNGFG